MSSKQLKSILNQIPSATAKGEREYLKQDFSKEELVNNSEKKIEIELDRIVARIPKILKNEIREYIKTHKGETDTTVILKGLKLMGFTIPNEWLIDKRTRR